MPADLVFHAQLDERHRHEYRRSSQARHTVHTDTGGRVF
jgi:hypothetical protein